MVHNHQCLRTSHATPSAKHALCFPILNLSVTAGNDIGLFNLSFRCGNLSHEIRKQWTPGFNPQVYLTPEARFLMTDHITWVG